MNRLEHLVWLLINVILNCGLLGWRSLTNNVVSVALLLPLLIVPMATVLSRFLRSGRLRCQILPSEKSRHIRECLRHLQHALFPVRFLLYVSKLAVVLLQTLLQLGVFGDLGHVLARNLGFASV